MYIWLLPRKCTKIGFLSQPRKLCSKNKICFDENDCNENLVFSWTYWDLDRTNETSESVHFIWWYIHKTSKVLYYVFEFKCFKVLRIKKPGLGPCLSYKTLRISMLRSWQQSALHKDMYDFLTGASIFTGGIHWTLPKKLNIMKLSLSLSVPWEIFCWKSFFLVLAHMQFPIQDHYIHTSRHRKGSI